VRVLVDNNLSPKIALAIHALVEQDGHEVVHLRKKFRPETDDATVLGRLAEEGRWAFLTLDMAIARKPHQRALWSNQRITIFFLERSWQRKGMSLIEQAGRLLLRWKDIALQFELVEPPAGFKVPLKGRLKQVRF